MSQQLLVLVLEGAQVSFLPVLHVLVGLHGLPDSLSVLEQISSASFKFLSASVNILQLSLLSCKGFAQVSTQSWDTNMPAFIRNVAILNHDSAAIVKVHLRDIAGAVLSE
jgi:hypothetical protein